MFFRSDRSAGPIAAGMIIGRMLYADCCNRVSSFCGGCGRSGLWPPVRPRAGYFCLCAHGAHSVSFAFPSGCRNVTCDSGRLRIRPAFLIRRVPECLGDRERGHVVRDDTFFAGIFRGRRGGDERVLVLRPCDARGDRRRHAVRGFHDDVRLLRDPLVHIVHLGHARPDDPGGPGRLYVSFHRDHRRACPFHGPSASPECRDSAAVCTVRRWACSPRSPCTVRGASGGRMLHSLRIRLQGRYGPGPRLAPESAPGCAISGVGASLRDSDQSRRLRHPDGSERCSRFSRSI